MWKVNHPTRLILRFLVMFYTVSYEGDEKNCHCLEELYDQVDLGEADRHIARLFKRVALRVDDATRDDKWYEVWASQAN